MQVVDSTHPMDFEDKAEQINDDELESLIEDTYYTPLYGRLGSKLNYSEWIDKSVTNPAICKVWYVP